MDTDHMQDADRSHRHGLIGMILDMSGAYSSLDGQGSVAAVQMAIDEMGGTLGGKPIELLSADHQNKSDIGTSIARQWADQDNVPT